MAENNPALDIDLTPDASGEELAASIREERGAAMVEYALLLVLIALVVVVALTFLGGTVSDTFSDINSGIIG